MSSVTTAVAMRLETTLALAMMPLATLAVTMWAMHLAAGADALRDFGGDDLCCAALFGDVGDWRFDSIGWKVSLPESNRIDLISSAHFPLSSTTGGCCSCCR